MEERVALVTGGLRGLGRAMALGLAREGHPVLAVGHLAEDVSEIERASAQLPGPLQPIVADLREAGECDRVVAAARERFGRVDILVNVVAVNLVAADRLSRRVAAAMVEGGWGRIVNVTTKLDTMNRAGTHPYGATKAALEMATEVWAKEVEGTGLTINIVNPGAGANTPGMADEM